MRVLLISWEYPPNVVGGMGKHVADLAPALAGQMVDDGPIYVDVLTTRSSIGAQEEQVNQFLTLYRADVAPINSIDYYNSVMEGNQGLIALAEQLGERHAYDLIHTHDWLVAKAGIALKHRWKTPLITTIHATERGRHQGHIANEASWQIDRQEWQCCFESWNVIACSAFMKQELQNYFGVPYAKTVVIPNGIDGARMTRCSDAQRALLRHRYAPDGERLLLYVGRIVHEKGLHVLIRAMPRILAEHPNTRLLVAGKNGEQYWPLAYELGVEKSVDFLGFVSDDERDCLYTIVDAAIFPSLYEPFGIVALEAMAAGANVIASGVGGLGEVIRHKENGLTVYANDPMSIVWAVSQTFSDPVAAAERRRRAEAEIEDLYSWPHIAEQTATLYNNIVRERRNTEW